MPTVPAVMAGSPPGPTSAPPGAHLLRAEPPRRHRLSTRRRLGVRPHHWSYGPMPPVAGLVKDEVAAHHGLRPVAPAPGRDLLEISAQLRRWPHPPDQPGERQQDQHVWQHQEELVGQVHAHGLEEVLQRRRRAEEKRRDRRRPPDASGPAPRWRWPRTPCRPSSARRTFPPGPGPASRLRARRTRPRSPSRESSRHESEPRSRGPSRRPPRSRAAPGRLWCETGTTRPTATRARRDRSARAAGTAPRRSRECSRARGPAPRRASAGRVPLRPPRRPGGRSFR